MLSLVCNKIFIFFVNYENLIENLKEFFII